MSDDPTMSEVDKLFEATKQIVADQKRRQQEAQKLVPPEWQQALQKLLDAGVPREQIRLLTSPDCSHIADALAWALEVQVIVCRFLPEKKLYLIDFRMLWPELKPWTPQKLATPPTEPPRRFWPWSNI